MQTNHSHNTFSSNQTTISNSSNNNEVKADLRETDTNKYNFMLKDLLSQEGNYLCADCNDKPTNSINTMFGVYVCSSCVINHRNFLQNYQIYIKNIDDKDWKDYHIDILKNCSNKKLNNFLELNYNINTINNEFDKKYLNKAFKFYLEKNISNNSNNDDKPNKENGKINVNIKDLINVYESNVKNISSNKPIKLVET